MSFSQFINGQLIVQSVLPQTHSFSLGSTGVSWNTVYVGTGGVCIGDGLIQYHPSSTTFSLNDSLDIQGTLSCTTLLTTLSGVSITAGVGYVKNVSMTGGTMGGQITFDYDSNGYTPIPDDGYVTVTFATAFSAPPFVVLTPASNKATKLLTGSNYYVDSTTTTFTIRVGDDTPAGSSVFSPVKFNYTVVGV